MFVVKNLLRRRVRTALSVMGVAIGIAAIVAFSAIGDGFQASLSTYFSESQAQLAIFSGNVADMAMSRVTREQKERVLAVPGVLEVSEGTFYVAASAGLRATGSLPALLLFGRAPGTRLMRKYDNGELRGRLLMKEDEILLGFLAAENLGKEPGDTLDFLERTFTVAGVYKTGATWENGGAVVHNAVIQKHLAMGDAFSLGFVYLKDLRQTERVQNDILNAVPGLSVTKATEVPDYFSDQLQYIDWFVWIVSLVAVIIGGLGVLNTMLMNVSERVREIGTLRAVGWSRPMVLWLIFSEGFLISVIGGVLGLAWGVAGAEILVHFAPKGFIHTVYTAEIFGKAAVVAAVLGVVGSLYPAFRASRLSPIEALKYE
ncbi:MAG: ABC transporter permease [Planctomycetes bacterium]|nr:ABC transporter permease [Planctomycetota bacterium]